MKMQRNNDNSNVEVRDTGRGIGKGLYAIATLQKGELIADWTGGKVYHADRATNLPNDLPLRVQDHAIQFEENSWIDTEGIGRYANHSCEPNCGIRGKFQLVTMREIRRGEELTFDYDMTEDSDWRMKCICENYSCRKVIGAFANMPLDVRAKYVGYVSEWLVEKYNFENSKGEKNE